MLFSLPISFKIGLDLFYNFNYLDIFNYFVICPQLKHIFSINIF